MKKNMLPIAIVAIILAVAVLHFSGTLLALEKGIVTISVDKFDFDNIKDMWVATVTVSSVSEKVIFRPTSDTVTSNEIVSAEKPDDLVTISLDDYVEYCTYTQGVKEEEIRVPKIVFHWGAIRIEEVEERCQKEVSKSGPAEKGKDWVVVGGWMDYYCISLIPEPVYKTSDGIEFKATFGVEYKGQKATATLTQIDSTIDLKLPNGKSVGFAQYIGAFLTLKNTCSGRTPDSMTASKTFVPYSIASQIQRLTDQLNGCWGVLRKSERVACVKDKINKINELWNSVQQPIGGDWTTIQEKGKTLNQYKVLNDVNVVRPTFILYLDTDWIKIYRPVGIPKIESLTAEDKVVSGDKLKINYKVCNIGEGDTQFNIKTICTAGFADSGDSTPLVKAKSCVEHYTYIGAICGDDTQKATCTLEFSGPTPVNGQIPKDSKEITTTCEAATTCIPDKKFCIGNTLYKCGSDGKERIKIEDCTKCVYNSTLDTYHCEGKPEEEGGEEGAISVFWIIIGAVGLIMAMVIVYVLAKRK